MLSLRGLVVWGTVDGDGTVRELSLINAAHPEDEADQDKEEAVRGRRADPSQEEQKKVGFTETTTSENKKKTKKTVEIWGCGDFKIV